jgi:ribose-phosphate pyrophosphokinase
MNIVLNVEAGQKWDKITVWVRFTSAERLEMQVFRLLLIAETASRYCDHLELKMPYFPYSLQDREVHTGDAVAAKVLIRAVEGVGVQSVTIVDAHAPANIQGWSIPVTHLRPERVLADAIQKRLQGKDIAVVAPDKGAVTRANLFGEYLHTNVYQLEKQRFGPGKVEIRAPALQSCPAQHLILVDDILNTGGTLVQSIRAIRDMCSAKMSIAVTHGFFVNLAQQRLLDAGAQYVFYTDTFLSGIDETQLGVQKVSILPLLLEET